MIQELEFILVMYMSMQLNHFMYTKKFIFTAKHFAWIFGVRWFMTLVNMSIPQDFSDFLSINRRIFNMFEKYEPVFIEILNNLQE